MGIKEIHLFDTPTAVRVARWTEGEAEYFFIEIPRKAYNILIPVAFLHKNGCAEKLRTLKYIGSPLRPLIYFNGQKYYITRKDTLYIVDTPEEVIQVLMPDSHDWVKECDPKVLLVELTY